MSLDPQRLETARRRLGQVYTFLRELDSHRNPLARRVEEQPWLEWLRHLPRHPDVWFNFPSDEQPLEDGRPVVLRIRRPHKAPAPVPPEEDAAWVEEGWTDPFRQVRFRATRRETSAAGEVFTVELENDAARVARLQKWQEARDLWAQRERPTREAIGAFERLYSLYGRMAREGEDHELVLGDGILSWRLPDGGIRHPVLLQRVDLRLNPQVPELVVVEAESPVELYSSIFRLAEGMNGSAVAALRQELELGGYHPLYESSTGFFRSLVARLSSRGEFLGNETPRDEKDDPRIWRDPVLFLRRRTLGFAAALEAVLEDLPQRMDLPAPLLRVVGADAPEPDPGDEEPGAVLREPTEIYLSQDANPEQVQVALRLTKSSSVVVQGPPGTGKTHTIANLIGDLLAKGQSVLVTSQTSKALGVLREKVVPALRPLCISVQGNDLDSRRQLDSSVEEILERISHSATVVERRAESLRLQRMRLVREIEEGRRVLQESRQAEYRPIVIAGQSYAPSDAARIVHKECEEHAWLLGPLAPGEPLPLSMGEINELYRTNESLTTQDEGELSERLPNPDSLPSIETVQELSATLAALRSLHLRFGEDLWNHSATESDRKCLRALLDSLHMVAEELRKREPWRLQLIDLGFRDAVHQRHWWSLLDEINAFVLKAAEAQEVLFRWGPELPKNQPLEELKRISSELAARVRTHGKLGLFTTALRRDWRTFLKESRVEGRRPEKPEHFEALATAADLEGRRRETVARWNRQSASIGLPSIGEAEQGSEIRLEQMAKLVRAALNWPAEVWQPLEQKLVAQGFRTVRLEECREPVESITPRVTGLIEDLVSKIIPAAEAQWNRAQVDHLGKQHEEWERQIEEFARISSGSMLLRKLRSAIGFLQIDEIDRIYSELSRLERLRPTLERRRSLLQRLEAFAPSWADAVRGRKGEHGQGDVPGNPESAWLWRQLCEELDRRHAIPVGELEQQVERKLQELRRVTGELIEQSAWAGQIRRTTSENQRALMGWRNIVRQTPKTSTIPGRMARLRREAQEAMRHCQTAVPVWIMPLSRVVESFDFRTTCFDVAILDEASQADVMALLVYYIARKVVIVGDHEQVSPTPVGQDEKAVGHLIDEHLQGIPQAILYNGKTSIYDLARGFSAKTICLLEHFRCVPRIIQFSNDLCYEGRIKPLRERGSLEPHVVPFRVEGAISERKVNQIEAETVASLLIAAIQLPEYRGKTFGVVSLVGEEQALEIDTLLREKLQPAEYESRRILCGNPAQFQGDERDVVFLSMVDSPGDGPLSLRTAPMFQQRFNVAASRAKDQLWVVYSLDPERDLKPTDLRRRLIEHALDPDALIRKLDRTVERAESELERAVIERLIRRGYQVTPQWRVGYYRIDIVVEGQGKRLAIECDGDRYHPLEKIPEDMWRQAALERLGWRFVRVRGSAFFRDPEAAMERVFAALERAGIEPEPEAGGEQESSDSTLRDEVIRRAATLRKQWKGRENGSEDPGSSSPGEAEPIFDENEVDDLPTTVGEVWLSLSHWAKVHEKFQPWERGVLYTVGDNLRSDRALSPKQRQLAARLYSTAVALGFDPQGNGSRQKPASEAAPLGHPAKTPVQATTKPGTRSKAISPKQIRAAVLRHIPLDGRVEREELLRLAMADLGFQRLTKDLRSRLNHCIGAQVRTGHLKTDWTLVWRAQP